MQKNIQLIIGSTRPTRIGGQIAQWVAEQAASLENVAIEIVDLRDFNLPLLDEPAMARTGVYEKDYTKAWSAQVAKADGFIFLTPEYNAGYPASLKNAIDYLYNEWTEKPALVVSYGYSGGASAQQQLIAVLNRMKVAVVDPSAALFITSESFDATGALISAEESFAPYKEELMAALTALDAAFVPAE